MDKLPLLKSVLINCFSRWIAKEQKGYADVDYKDIREAMLAINMFDNYTVDPYFASAIIDYYLRKLNEL